MTPNINQLIVSNIKYKGFGGVQGHGMHVEARGYSERWFSPNNTRHRTYAVRLGDKHLYPLSHLTSTNALEFLKRTYSV